MPWKHGGLLLCLLPPATKLGQGYVFTGICDSVRRGVSASVHAGIHPQSRHPYGADTPWEQTPSEQTPPPPPPGSRHHPEQTPQSRHPNPPTTEHAGRYGQCVGGTHPTGIQSCYLCHLQKKHNKEASRLYAELLLMSSRSIQMLSLMSSRSMLIIGTSSLTCGWHADDMQLLPGVVLFKIRELKQVESQRNQTNH